MARIAEVYLSTLSSIMQPHGIAKCFVAVDFLCAHSGEVTQQELARELRIDKVSAMRMINYLCDRDLVSRRQDENDRRCHKLEVTDKARKVLPLVHEAVEKTNAMLFEDFTDSEMKRFEKSMDKLYKKIGTLPEPNFIVREFKRNKSN